MPLSSPPDPILAQVLPEGGVRVKSIALSATTTTWLTCSSVTQVGTSERASLAIAPHTTRSRAVPIFRWCPWCPQAQVLCGRRLQCRRRGRRVAACWRHGARAGARPLLRLLDRRRSHRSPSIAPLCALAAHSLARVVVRRSSAVSGRKVIAAAGCGGWEDILLSSPRAFSKSTFRRRSLAWPQSGVARGLSPQGLSIKRRRPLAHREGCEPPCVVAVCRVRASATARPR